MQCAVRNNRVVRCEGEFMPSEGCCFKHAMLFDVWLCDYFGHRVYLTGYPHNWKRSKFHQWLNQLGEENAQKILSR